MYEVHPRPDDAVCKKALAPFIDRIREEERAAGRADVDKAIAVTRSEEQALCEIRVRENADEALHIQRQNTARDIVERQRKERPTALVPELDESGVDPAAVHVELMEAEWAEFELMIPFKVTNRGKRPILIDGLQVTDGADAPQIFESELLYSERKDRQLGDVLMVVPRDTTVYGTIALPLAYEHDIEPLEIALQARGMDPIIVALRRWRLKPMTDAEIAREERARQMSVSVRGICGGVTCRAGMAPLPKRRVACASQTAACSEELRGRPGGSCTSWRENAGRPGGSCTSWRENADLPVTPCAAAHQATGPAGHAVRGSASDRGRVGRACTAARRTARSRLLDRGARDTASRGARYTPLMRDHPHHPYIDNPPAARAARLLAIVGLTLAACGGGSGGNSDAPEQAALDSALTTWSGTAAAHYRMTTQRACECTVEYAMPIVVEVVDDAIVSATYATTGDPVSAEVQSSLYTIDGLFTVIQGAIDTNAYQVMVDYDATSGRPVAIFIDYDQALADEEFALTVRDFAVIP